MQSLFSVLSSPLDLALRRQSLGSGSSLAQHCAAMSESSSGFGHSTRPTDEVTASSPGHRQKIASRVSELPAKMAMPDSGIGTRGGGGGHGDDMVFGLKGVVAAGSAWR